jgi:hypothetical protein
MNNNYLQNHLQTLVLAQNRFVFNVQPIHMPLQLQLPNFEALSLVKFDKITLEEIIPNFISTLESHHTKRSYTSKLNMMFKRGFLDKNHTISEFSKENIPLLLQAIRKNQLSLLISNHNEEKDHTICDATLQASATVFQSLCRFLELYTNGLIKYTICAKTGHQKVFKKQYTKTQSSILTREELSRFLDTLEAISFESWCVSIMQLKGARR